MVILVQKSHRPRRWAGVALFAAVIGVVLWLEHRELNTSDLGVAAGSLPHAGVSFEPPAPLHLASLEPSFAAEPMVANPPGAIGMAGPPEGMTAQQWLALRESLKDHPQRDAEIARVSEYMAFQSRFEHYRALRAQGASGEAAARELASGLLDALPAHAARGELSAGEAALMQQALIDTLLPEASRAARRGLERKRLADALPVRDDLQASDERNARFQREQAALVARWQALPAAQRDTQALEASIAALRQSIFDKQRTQGQQP